MEVTITTRHCDVPSTTREQLLERMHRVERFEPRAASALVSFARDHGRRQVEARVNVHGGPHVIARATADSFRVALGRSMEKLERQLRRRRGRIRTRRTSRRTVPRKLETP